MYQSTSLEGFEDCNSSVLKFQGSWQISGGPWWMQDYRCTQEAGYARCESNLLQKNCLSLPVFSVQINFSNTNTSLNKKLSSVRTQTVPLGCTHQELSFEWSLL